MKIMLLQLELKTCPPNWVAKRTEIETLERSCDLRFWEVIDLQKVLAQGPLLLFEYGPAKMVCM